MSESSIPAWRTALTQVAPGAYAYIQGGGPGADNASVSNAGLIVAGGRVIAIDALFAPVQTKAFIAEIDRITAEPVTDLINTHHHVDHITGNCFFRPARIIAHARCREEMIATGLRIDYVRRKPEWQPGVEELELVLPQTTFEDRLTWHLDGLEVQLIHLGMAHTAGDVMVYLPQHKVLFAGDVAFHYVIPLAHSGHISSWMNVVDAVRDLDIETVVPGHGPIGTRRELSEMREYFETLKAEARRRFDAELSPAEAVADIRLGRFDAWTNPERIVQNILRLYQEFRGEPPLTPLDEGQLEEARRAFFASRQ